MLSDRDITTLGEIWAELLTVDPPSRESNFFGDGGDSLSAVEFVEVVESRFGKELSLRLLFQDGRFGAIVDALSDTP